MIYRCGSGKWKLTKDGARCIRWSWRYDTSFARQLQISSNPYHLVLLPCVTECTLPHPHLMLGCQTLNFLFFCSYRFFNSSTTKGCLFSTATCNTFFFCKLVSCMALGILDIISFTISSMPFLAATKLPVSSLSMFTASCILMRFSIKGQLYEGRYITGPSEHVLDILEQNLWFKFYW